MREVHFENNSPRAQLTQLRIILIPTPPSLAKDEGWEKESAIGPIVARISSVIQSPTKLSEEG
jgi:hypothetical protein